MTENFNNTGNIIFANLHEFVIHTVFEHNNHCMANKLEK